MIVLADKGLAGREMERYAADQVKVLLARPDRKDERRRFGNLAGMRQWVEAIFDTSRTSSAWNDTADAPPPASTPASPSDCWPRDRWPADRLYVVLDQPPRPNQFQQQNRSTCTDEFSAHATSYVNVHSTLYPVGEMRAQFHQH
jgi:hypothetical protein